MNDPTSTWHAEHAYFRRLLGMLQAGVEAFHRDARPNYELMLDIISYLREYGDESHHRREEVAFARLAERRPDMKTLLARLAQEHRVIANAGEALQEKLRAAVNGSILPRVEVEVAAATYLVYYGNHIAKEEEDVLSSAAGALTAQDWEAVRSAVPDARDPLFQGGPQERFRELRRQIALESS